MSDFPSQPERLSHLYRGYACGVRGEWPCVLPRWRAKTRLPWLTWPVVALVLATGWFRCKGGQREREKIEALVSALAADLRA